MFSRKTDFSYATYNGLEASTTYGLEEGEPPVDFDGRRTYLMKMKIIRKISVLLTCLFLFAAGGQVILAYEESPLQNRIVRLYDQNNGLPTGEANTVIQTSDGYVWIGSYGGLIRYDGTTFRNYSEEGSVKSSSIRMLFEDSRGRLWIGTNDMGIYLYENGKFTLIGNDNDNAYLSVRSFAEGSDGTVYAGTTSGLAKVSENGVEAVEEVSGSTVYSIACDENGVIWACLDNGIGKLLKNGEVIYTFESGKLLSPAALYCAGTDKNGGLWLGTDSNILYKVDFKDSDYTDRSFTFTRYFTDVVTTFNAIGEDMNGNIWAAALNGTGYIDPEGDWHTVNNEHAAAANDLAFDYEGNVWIASTSYGIVHLVSGLYLNPNAVSGLSETSLNAVAVSGDSYYVGTDTGLIILGADFVPVENELTEMLAGDRIRNIFADSKGNVWIGTYYVNGLVLYRPDTGEITSFTQEEGLTNTQIRHIIELSDGGIAVATQSGVNIIRNGKVSETYAEAEGLSYPIILALCEGTDGTIYAGSDGQGIFAIKDGVVTHYGFDQGLSAGVVLRMAADGSGLFISAGNSLYYWDFNSFTLVENYKKSAGSILDLKIVDDQLWLMQSNGVHILDLGQLMSGEETTVNLVGSAYGLTGSLNANTWNVIRDGTLYLCTSNGLSVLEINSLNGADVYINAVISQVTADDAVFESPESIDIGGETTRLTFRFAPLAFSGTDVTVRYQLAGFDDRSYTLTNDSAMSASYTNLSGGDYEFLVEVLGKDGETVIASRSVAVRKNYTLFEQTWFRALMAIVGLLLVFLAAAVIARIKTIRLRRRQQEYRSIINQALRTFANTIDAKDKYTNGHSARVAHYSLEIARRLKLSEEDQERIYYIALLHDIGKIGIPDSILTKPDKLTPEERQLIMQHPTIGGEILKDFNSIKGISDGAKYHHERYDGTGYNEGLKGKEIPFFARIICVADSYDAMSSVRYYQGNLSSDIIIKELEEGSGSQFDPEIVEIMLQLIREGKAPCSELMSRPLSDIENGAGK